MTDRNDNLTGVRNAMIEAIVDNNTKEYYIKITDQTKTMRIQDEDQDEEDAGWEKRLCKSILHGRQVPFEHLQLWMEVIMEPV